MESSPHVGVKTGDTVSMTILLNKTHLRVSEGESVESEQYIIDEISESLDGRCTQLTCSRIKE